MNHAGNSTTGSPPFKDQRSAPADAGGLGRLAVPVSMSGLLLCGLIGMLLGSGGYTVYYGQGLSYLSNDPKACVNCHIMRDHYDGWQKASHHGVATCNDCHMPEGWLAKYLSKAENGFWHSKGFTFDDFHEPIRIRPKNALIVQRNCERCHREMVSEITGHGMGFVTRGEGRSVEQTSHCVRCHDSVGHGATR
jgi:cytochrome c nitrite reductase small subunit